MNSLSTGVLRFLLVMDTMLLLDNFIEQIELHPILINFDKEIWKIREKYWNTGFPSNFVNETIPNFKKETEQAIIPEWIFEEKNTLTVRLICKWETSILIRKREI